MLRSSGNCRDTAAKLPTFTRPDYQPPTVSGALLADRLGPERSAIRTGEAALDQHRRHPRPARTHLGGHVSGQPSGHSRAWDDYGAGMERAHSGYAAGMSPGTLPGMKRAYGGQIPSPDADRPPMSR